MKKRLLSLLLTLVMILGMIPATSLTAFAVKELFTTSVTGIEVTGDGYYINPDTNNYHLGDIDVSMISGTSKLDPDSCGSNSIYTDEACTTRLKTEPKLDETYYFNVYVLKDDTTNNITNSNSNIKIGGFYGGKVLSTETTNDGFFYCVCSITYGELTGGVKAVASGVEYDSAEGGYAPNFTTLKAVSTEGKELEHTMVDGKYSYYGAKSGCFYKTNSGTSFSNMLTTEPQVGETYYSYFLLDSIDGNLNIEEDLVDIRIPDYEVEYLASYERDMGFTSLVVYSVTKLDPKVYVGGVGMYDGDYLAVGATTTQTTKPSGGYAYYKDGTLTLNNYSYEGEGYRFGAVYIPGTDLTIELLGDNTLVQTKSGRDAICADNANLTIDGTGKLTCRGEDHGIWVGRGLSINGGTITAIGNIQAIRYYSSDGFSVAESLTMQASTTVDGELGEYVAENHDSYKKIVITPPDVYVGGVGMCDGDYLAVGATTTQTTKPSGGYAYYKDGELTLNNYSYEGDGYEYDSDEDYYAVIYSKNDLTLELIGNNTLAQTRMDSDTIYVSGASLIVGGTGSLTNTDDGYGIYADQDITINSGTIHSTGHYTGIRSENGSVVINGGDVTAIGNSGIRAQVKFVANGGTITATCRPSSSDCAIYTKGSVIFGSNMTVQASTTVAGELGEYVAENHDSYKKIVVQPGPEVYVVGDVNGDGLVNAKDALLLRKSIAAGNASSLDLKVADVNGDGVINAKDVVKLRRIVTGGYN